jgi:hypothetical protein
MTDRAPLAVDLVRVLAAEPSGMSCDMLATKLARRRAHVLAALRDDQRFEHVGGGRWSRWQLSVGTDGGRVQDGLEGAAGSRLDSDLIRELLSRVEALELRLDAERRNGSRRPHPYRERVGGAA